MQLRKLIATLVFCSASSWGAISIDTNTVTGSVAILNASSTTWNHTVSGSNTLLVVVISERDTIATSSGCYAASITYAGQNLTVANATINGLGTYSRTELWYLVAPAAGSNAIVITLSGRCNEWIPGAVSLTGVLQSSPLNVSTGAFNTASVNATTATLVSVANHSAVVDVGRFGSTPTNLTPSISTMTMRADIHGTNAQMGMSTSIDVTPSGNVDDAWRWTTANTGGCVSAASFKPAVVNTWSVVQAKTTAAGTPCAVTVTSVGAGHTLIASIKGGLGSAQPITSVTSTGDTWSAPGTSMSVFDTAGGFLDTWYLLSAAGGETTVTVNSTVNTTNCYVWEISSSAGTAVFDASGTADDSTSTGKPLGIQLTLAGSNDLIIQNNKSGGTISAINNNYFSPAGIAISNGITASSNTASGTAPTWTTTAGNTDAVNAVAFKEASAAASAAPPSDGFILKGGKLRIMGKVKI